MKLKSLLLGIAFLGLLSTTNLSEARNTVINVAEKEIIVITALMTVNGIEVYISQSGQETETIALKSKKAIDLNEFLQKRLDKLYKEGWKLEGTSGTADRLVYILSKG